MTGPARSRFHLTLASAGRPVMHGWWSDGATAYSKFRDWIGSYGSLPDAQVTLVDTDTGRIVATWPGET